MWYLSNNQQRNLSRPNPYLNRVRNNRNSEQAEKCLPSMRTGSELPLICVPVVGRWVQTLLLVSLHQLIQVIHPHTSTDNFSHIRHQDINSFCEAAVVFTLLHVESFNIRGESMQHDWFVDSVGHEPFRSFWYIFTNLIVGTIFLFVVMILQPLDCLRIFHSSERLLWRNKSRIEFINQVAERRLEGPIYH